MTFRKKPHLDIVGASPELISAAVKHQGHAPDNFVDSPEAGLAQLPDLRRTEAGRKLGMALEERLRNMVTVKTGTQYTGDDLRQFS